MTGPKLMRTSSILMMTSGVIEMIYITMLVTGSILEGDSRCAVLAMGGQKLALVGLFLLIAGYLAYRSASRSKVSVMAVIFSVYLTFSSLGGAVNSFTRYGAFSLNPYGFVLHVGLGISTWFLWLEIIGYLVLMSAVVYLIGAILSGEKM